MKIIILFLLNSAVCLAEPSVEKYFFEKYNENREKNLAERKNPKQPIINAHVMKVNEERYLIYVGISVFHSALISGSFDKTSLKHCLFHDNKFIRYCAHQFVVYTLMDGDFDGNVKGYLVGDDPMLSNEAWETLSSLKKKVDNLNLNKWVAVEKKKIGKNGEGSVDCGFGE